MDQGLPGVFTSDVAFEELEVVLNLWGSAIVLRSRAHRDGCERRSVVQGVVCLKRLVSEIQPRPSTLLISALLLQCPHVVESGPRVVAQFAVPGIRAGQDQRIENGLRPAGLETFVGPAGFGIKRRDLSPQAHAFGDAFHQPKFVLGRGFFPKYGAQSGSRKCVRHRRMTGKTEGAMIARGRRPRHPPAFSLVEVSGGRARSW